MGMSGSDIQTSQPPAEGALQDRGRPWRDLRGQADAHRPTPARAAPVLAQLDIVRSSDHDSADDALAREINAEHGHVETYKHNTIRHAIRCGELLLEMKRRVGHGNWLTWLEENFEASERTARNYMEIAKSAAVADLRDDATMRSALRALASSLRSKEPRAEQTRTVLATVRIPVEDSEGLPETEVVQTPRASLGKTNRLVWATIPARLTTIERALGEAAGEELDDHRAAEALYKASREAHLAATDLEQLAATLHKHAS
jgi:hypothetical protein